MNEKTRTVLDEARGILSDSRGKQRGKPRGITKLKPGGKYSDKVVAVVNAAAGIPQAVDNAMGTVDGAASILRQAVSKVSAAETRMGSFREALKAFERAANDLKKASQMLADPHEFTD